MPKELMYVLIAKMHIKLNRLIEGKDFNLQNEEVQHYSRRLDKVLARYNRKLEESKKYSCRFCPYGNGAR